MLATGAVLVAACVAEETAKDSDDFDLLATAALAVVATVEAVAVATGSVNSGGVCC